MKLIGHIPLALWRSLLLYYKSSRAAVRLGWKTSEIFVVEEGVKQGGILSPFLFNFFINDLIVECADSGLGARVREINTCIVGYCDDLILLSPLESHLHALLLLCERYATKWRIKFNPRKSIIYCTNVKLLKDACFVISGGQLPVAEGFVYLGLPIGDQKFLDEWLEKKFRSVEVAFFTIRKVGLHKNQVDPFCLAFIYRQFCQSICVYGLEILRFSKCLLKQLDKRQALLIKKTLGLSKFVRTTPLFNALKIPSLNELYFKFKFLFLKQCNNNDTTSRLYEVLSACYVSRLKPKSSFLWQLVELDGVLGQPVNEIPKDQVLPRIYSLLRSKNKGLVDSLVTVFKSWEAGENRSINLVRLLLWVPFDTWLPEVELESDGSVETV